MGNTTKFITPAKFSIERMVAANTSPSAPSARPESTIAAQPSSNPAGPEPDERPRQARHQATPLPQEPEQLAHHDPGDRAHAQAALDAASGWPVRARNTASRELTPAARLSSAGVPSAASEPRSSTATRSHGSASST